MSDRLTARDVKSQSFNKKVRGYDPEDVDLFLRSVSEELERVHLENAELKEEVGHLRERVEDFRARERTLQDTLLTAQRMAGELKEQTQSESEILVKEARIKAERLLETAQDQLASIEAEISRCKLERDMFENRLRNTIEEHVALIDMRRQERESEPDNLHFIRRRQATEAG